MTFSQYVDIVNTQKKRANTSSSAGLHTHVGAALGIDRLWPLLHITYQSFYHEFEPNLIIAE